VREELQRRVDAFSRVIPRGAVRWMQAGQIHLTLKFLGDVESARVEAVRGALGVALQGTHPVALELAGHGVFPSLDRPRVLWAGVTMPTDDLFQIHERIELAMAGLGFEREERAFAPHLTLGRVREGAGSVYLNSVREAITNAGRETSLPFSASKVTLFRSQLKPEGAVYSALAEFPLETQT
jgi:RNA 2',3'-cyclic 3'-phosphodiesterase